MLMTKYLLIDKYTSVLLSVDKNAQISNFLANGLNETQVLRMEPAHPLYSQINKTMMAGKILTVSPRLTVKDDTTTLFPEETITTINYVKLREPIMSRLFDLCARWISQSAEMVFPGMESIVEIELRDCDHSNNEYTANIHFHAEMMGMTASEAYEQLNAIAARGQKKRMRGMSFIYKYSKMINNVVTSSDAERINALMYQEWDAFTEKFTKEIS
jgi:hypothetical protein